jgi:hypothetical protein
MKQTGALKAATLYFCFISFIGIYYPLTNICKHFQMISEMSENDLKTLGHSVGFPPVLDNPRTARYNPTQAGAFGHSGIGLCNNRPFSRASEYQIASAQSTSLDNIANTAIQHKLSRYLDTSMSLVQNGIYGAGNTLMTVTNLALNFALIIY